MTSANQNQPNLFPLNNVKNEVLKEVIDLLNEGEIRLNNQYGLENATLLLGGSGTGKSTLALRLAGNDAKMKSEKKFRNYIIIKPDSDVISSTYSKSTTIFPQLIMNNETHAAYYDFPGFVDTRGAGYDISTTYFIKKVVDNIQRVKLLFLINESAFSVQGERDSFTKLIRHITQFVRDIDKFEPSMALIVTKVPPSTDSDNETISSIADFMREAKSELEKQTNKKNDYSRDIRLIDVFLLKEGDSYPKIGISKSPDRKGFLSEIPSLQENKNNIEGMIEKLRFAERSEPDFGFFIPKQSLNDVGKMIDEVNENILDNIEKSGKEIQKYLSSKESELYDISKLYNETISEYDKLSWMRTKADEHKNCVLELAKNVASMNSLPAYQSLLPAVQYSNFSSFLRTVSNDSPNHKFNCTKGLDRVLEYSADSKNWYSFLNTLFNQLSGYEVQKNISETKPCITLAKKVAQYINDEKYSMTELLPVLKECYPEYDYELHGIQNVTLDKHKLNNLLKTLKFTLMYTLEMNSCESNKLVIKGTYIKTTDVQKAIVQKCKNVPPKFIEIFALNKVFFDNELNFTDYQVHFSIIAPVWDIQGAAKIMLDGGPGKAHNPSKASDGIFFAEDGDHGLPGFPGRPGGNFLGIGDRFIHPERLTVSVNGGQGGPGQNGGDGMAGRGGNDAYNDVEYHGSIFYYQLDEFISKSGQRIVHAKVVSSDLLGIISLEHFAVMTVLGESGSAGRNGGNGGKGGVGGYPGRINFIPLSFLDVENVHQEMNIGKDGLNGFGGKGAIGGKNGDNLNIKYLWPFRYIDEQRISIETRRSNGTDGINGGNAINMQLAEVATLFSNPSGVVNDYKSYAEKNLNQSVMEFYLTEFLTKLETNNHTQNHLRKRRHADKDIENPNQHIAFDTGRANTQNFMNYNTATWNANNTPISSDKNMDKDAHLTENSSKSFDSHIKAVMSNLFAPLNFLKSNNPIMNHESVGDGIKSQSLVQTTTKNYVNQAGLVVKFDVNESLALADFVVRCVTKIKPYNSAQQSTNSSEVKASALGIITVFEKILSNVCEHYKLSVECLEFDPVVLMAKLEKQMITPDLKKITEILYHSIINKSHVEDIEIYNYMEGSISEMLKGQNEGNLCN